MDWAQSGWGGWVCSRVEGVWLKGHDGLGTVGVGRV